MGTQREYIVLDEKKLVYLNNSKVACSSIKSTFLDRETKDDYSIHNAMEKRKRGLNGTEKGYYKFTFVRNPYERLVSCYESRYHTPNKSSWFDYYLFGFMKEDKGFEVFLKNAMKMPDRIADRHFRSQHYLVYGKGNKALVDFVGRFENLDSEYANIADKYKLKELPHFNASGRKDYRNYYTKEMAEKVYRRFRKDFEAFGYEWAYADLISWLAEREGNKMEAAGN